jgi:hypothetical protein
MKLRIYNCLCACAIFLRVLCDCVSCVSVRFFCCTTQSNDPTSICCSTTEVTPVVVYFCYFQIQPQVVVGSRNSKNKRPQASFTTAVTYLCSEWRWIITLCRTRKKSHTHTHTHTVFFIILYCNSLVNYNCK